MWSIGDLLDATLLFEEEESKDFLKAERNRNEWNTVAAVASLCGLRLSVGCHCGILRVLAQFQTDCEGTLFRLELVISREVLRIER
ncbi:MAG TPA: hypothetical protein VK638_24720 [Edaphobacter sp.]|nr:hypothetical protein [Edaphobacter sp.]